MLPESKLSHAQVLMDYWVGEHIGAELAMTGHQHIDAVRGPLTRSLSNKFTALKFSPRETIP